jgi:hypothetical protein
MNKQTNYYFLSGFFFVVFLISQFTDVYKSPMWFKAFVLILCVAFLISGLANKTKTTNEDDEKK